MAPKGGPRQFAGPRPGPKACQCEHPYFDEGSCVYCGKPESEPPVAAGRKRELNA